MNASEVNAIVLSILNRSLSFEEKSLLPVSGENVFPDENEANRLLAFWEKIVVRPGAQPGRFEAHLRDRGMTRDQALTRLMGRVVPDDTAWPPWAQLLRDILLDNRSPADDPAISQSPAPASDSSPSPAGEAAPVFPEFLNRFVRIILDRIRRRMGDSDGLIAPSAMRDLSLYALRRLSAQAARTVAFDVKNQAAWQMLRGETPEDRYRYWVSDVLGSIDGLGQWLAHYPVLGRLLASVSLHLIEAASMLLLRLRKDHRELARPFGIDGKLGSVTEIAMGFSDPHRHGQTVCRLTFEGGVRVIYKPRSLSVDALFHNLVHWWNRQQPLLSLHTVNMVRRRDYGWCEFVQRRECQTSGEVSRYFRRQGVHLALFYLLGGTDFHHENFIPFGEWPVPIDLEALLALGIFDPYPPAGHAPPCLQPLSATVMSTLMLPAWQSGSHDRPLAYISGIDGGGDRVAPTPKPRWIHLGTDRLQLVHEYHAPDTSCSRPVFCGQPVSVQAHVSSLMEGFQLAYRTLEQAKGFLMLPEGPLASFRSTQNRRIMRATRQYDELLFWSTSPDLLTSGSIRDVAFERLCEHPLGPMFTEVPVIAEEKRSLWDADIPIFYNRADSRCFRSSSGAKFRSLDTQTPFHLMKQRLAGFCEEDMNWQIELIRCSLAMTFEPAKQAPSSHPSETPEQSAGDAPTPFMVCAVALGEALARLAVRDDRGCRWLTLRRPQTYASEVFYQVTDPWLYAGTAGAGLFFANLAAVTGQSRFAELAEASLNFAGWHHRYLVDHPIGGPVPLSGYCGHGSLIYAFAEAGRLLKDGQWLDQALSLRAFISRERIEQEQNPDVVGGLAGLLWALLFLYRAAPDPEIRADMIAIGHRLVALQGERPEAAGWPLPGLGKALLGMGHGAAGVANALGRLYALTGLEVFRQAAQKGLQFERLHFSPIHADWPNLQDPSAEPSFMTGWCAGAPGAGLARLSLKRIFPEDDALDKEIECAVSATLRHLGADSHHLCCGESGRILFLLQAAEQLDSPALALRASEAGLNLLRFHENHGFWQMQSCSERSILPELMGGISGIGLTFLTLAVPGQRSRVLTLE